MPLVHLSVYRDPDFLLLADASAATGNFAEVLQDILPQLPSPPIPLHALCPSSPDADSNERTKPGGGRRSAGGREGRDAKRPSRLSASDSYNSASNSHHSAKDSTPPQQTTRFFHEVDGFKFSFFRRQGFIFVAVGDPSSNRSVATGVLDRMSDRFLSPLHQPLSTPSQSGPNPNSKHLSSKSYADQARLVNRPGALDLTFGRQLRELLGLSVQHPEEFSKMEAVQQQVNAVKETMAQNIDRILAQAERLDVISEKSNALLGEADRFRKAGLAIKGRLQCQNLKVKAIAAGVVLLVALIIFLLACFSGGNCLK